ncbi:MAG: hypothetical protein HKL98_12300 [Burkholderiales bacterium]|nr:hypothetical protein [Burkholderiales bacterium]
MVLLRLIGFAVLVAIGVSFLAYLLKGDRRYLNFAWALFRFTLLLLLAFGILYFVERIILVA